MPNSQDLKLEKLIRSCGNCAIRSHEYMRHLGLPISKDRAGAKGHAKFDDQTGQVDNFYKSTNAKFNELYNNHETRQEVRQRMLPASEELIDEVTNECLQNFGPVIWKASGNRLTRITEHYPRYLEYTEYEDFQRIRSCVYHWIIHRAIRKYANDGSKLSVNNGSRPRFPRPTMARKSCPRIDRNISDSDDTDLDTSGDYGERNIRGVKTANMISPQSRPTSNNQNCRMGINGIPYKLPDLEHRPQVALGQTMSPFPVNEANASGMPQTTELESQYDLHRETSSTLQSEEVEDRPCLNDHNSGRHAHNKRRADSTSQEPIKRMKSPKNPGSNAPNHNSHGRRGISTTEFVYHSILQSAAREDLPLNFPKVGDASTTVSQGATMSLDKQASSRWEYDSVLDGNEDEVQSSSELGAPANLIANDQPRNDSSSLVVVLKANPKASHDTIQEISMIQQVSTSPISQVSTLPTAQASTLRAAQTSTLPIAEASISPTAEISTSPPAGTSTSSPAGTLVSPTQLTPPTPWTPQVSFPLKSTRSQCVQLTSKLLNLLGLPNHGPQGVRALKEVMGYIIRITEDDAAGLRHLVGEAYDRHHGTLYRWLGCANAFVKFREATGFYGDKSQWKTFYRDLVAEQRNAARTAFFNTRAVIQKWCDETEFTITGVSKDLAFTIFRMTSWEGIWEDMMDLEEMEQLLTRFNETLLAWFS